MSIAAEVVSAYELGQVARQVSKNYADDPVSQKTSRQVAQRDFVPPRPPKLERLLVRRVHSRLAHCRKGHGGGERRRVLLNDRSSVTS